MDLLGWFFVAALLILMCLAYSPLFIFLFKITSPISTRIIAWFKRPNAQQIKEEEAAQLKYNQEKERLINEFLDKRKEERKQKIQKMLADGSLGKINKTVDEICLASEEVLELRGLRGSVVRDMLGEGKSMEYILKAKREADVLILAEASIKSGIDYNLLKRIVENLEDLDNDESPTT